VVYDGKGDIVTSAYVVGTALGVFAPDDLAVIRVGSGVGALHPASFGRSASVQAGEIVLAMGNPLGLTGTVTTASSRRPGGRSRRGRVVRRS